MPLSQASQPLYHRVSREIAREIESGTLQPADGLIEGRGRGSLVRGGALAEPPNTLMSLSELGRSRGLDATARVLSAAVRAATIDEAEAFAIAPGADVFELERVRMLDGVPISIDHNRVPLRLGPGLTDVDFTTASLYEALERAGNPPRRADYELEARGADAPEAELLGLAPGAPVLLTKTVAIGDGGRIVDLGRTVYRADRYRFHATLMRRVHRQGENDNEELHASGVAAARTGDPRRRVRRNAG